MDDLILTSSSNPRVRAWLRLRDRAGRDAAGLSLVDGAREVGRAVAAGAEVVEAIIGPRATTTDEGRATVAALRHAAVPMTLVGETVADRIAFGDRADGLVAVVRVPPLDLSRLAVSAEPLIVVLDRLEKPGNLGAVLRSADGAGVDALIVSDPVTDLYNPNAIRASLGTIFGVPVAAGTSDDVRGWIRQHRIRPVAALVDGATPYTEADLTGPIALVLGSEAQGLGPAWRDPEVTAVRIPMRGAADSLNVSVAAAILLFEARRQRDAT